MENIREKLVELLKNEARCPEVATGCHDCPYRDGEEDFCDSASATADMLIAHGVTVQEWVPVTERLPEEGEDVLTYRKSGYRVEALESVSRNDWEEDLFSYWPVTHWMHLPKPPKGE